MLFFLALMVAGFTGLIFLALPGMLHHGMGSQHAGHTGHDGGHIGHGGHAGHTIGSHHAGHLAHSGQHAGGHPTGHAAHGHGAHAEETAGTPVKSFGGLVPSPRVIFTWLALYGAFGYGLVGGAHWTPLLAGLAALVPTWLVDRLLVTPLWNLLFQFQGKPDSPLESLVMGDAEAVTPFTNGRGMVSVVRDGRLVQFCAHLADAQAGMRVRVGDKLRIEEVDAENERLTVTLR
ncbi:MAG TPA: hypothetical protein VFB38_16350 [Chthonomonadaceae bacterium]|nr:hypothetical protein [Chthonomonadaceae bacterium]